MSSKRKTPKKKSKEEDILFQAVNQIVKHKKNPKNKTPKNKTPKNKTPKQKGGLNILEKINTFISPNKTKSDEKKDKSLQTTDIKNGGKINAFYPQGIQIDSTLTPLDGNINKSLRITFDVLEDEITTENMETATKNKGGYGKKFINNHIRLYEGSDGNIHLFHSI